MPSRVTTANGVIFRQTFEWLLSLCQPDCLSRPLCVGLIRWRNYPVMGPPAGDLLAIGDFLAAQAFYINANNNHLQL